MSQKCSQSNCDNDAYEEQTKCILHCEKSEYSVDFHKIGFLKDFYDELIKYISKRLNKYQSIDIALPYDELIKFFTGGIETIAESNREILLDNIKSHTVVLDHIVFPDRKSRDSFDYVKVLQKLGELHFLNCEFHVKWMELEGRKCFFDECKFYDWWSLGNYKLLEKSGYAIYERCIFNKEVSTSVSQDEELILEASQFDNCQFFKLNLHDTIFSKPIFENTNNEENEIRYLSISDCIVKDKFILNNYKIEYMSLTDSVFEKKFEFKYNKDVQCTIANTNFEGLVDCYETSFKKFIAQKSIFNDFVGFEKCIFGNFDDEEPTLFQHTTFLSFVNFREAHFRGGLDMRDANLKEYPNFLGAEITFKNTNKETYRIIKHSFDKVGNTTEANRYYANEMDKERRDISLFSNPSKKITLWFSHHISHHGQSFIFPLIWIITIGVIHHYFNIFCDTYTIADITPKYHDVIEEILNWLNSFAKNILPFKRFLTEGREFFSLLFLIAYSALIYHFIIAVKRMTKR